MPCLTCLKPLNIQQLWCECDSNKYICSDCYQTRTFSQCLELFGHNHNLIDVEYGSLQQMIMKAYDVAKTYHLEQSGSTPKPITTALVKDDDDDEAKVEPPHHLCESGHAHEVQQAEEGKQQPNPSSVCFNCHTSICPNHPIRCACGQYVCFHCYETKARWEWVLLLNPMHSLFDTTVNGLITLSPICFEFGIHQLDVLEVILGRKPTDDRFRPSQEVYKTTVIKFMEKVEEMKKKELAKQNTSIT